MDIQGKVIEVLLPRTIVAKSGQSFVHHSFVVEYGGQYPKRALLVVKKDDLYQKMALVVGGVYTFSFDADAREWNGKWFNELVCWRAVRIS